MALNFLAVAQKVNAANPDPFSRAVIGVAGAVFNGAKKILARKADRARRKLEEAKAAYESRSEYGAEIDRITGKSSVSQTAMSPVKAASNYFASRVSAVDKAKETGVVITPSGESKKGGGMVWIIGAVALLFLAPKLLKR